MFDLRRLVEQAHSLATPDAPRRQHPLGLGLPATHSLSPSEGEPKLRIPKRADGLQALQAIVVRDVLDLTLSEVAAAWHFLLNKPGLCAPLRAPTVSELLTVGFPVAPDAGLRIRAAALAVVLRRRQLDTPEISRHNDEEDEVRIAGVGRLVVVTDPNNPAVSLDAWTDIRWVRSARALSRGMESLYRTAMPSARQAGSRKTAMLLLGDELADAVDANSDSDFEQVLSDVAAVHSYSLQILRRPRRHVGNIIDVVRNTPPSLLVIAASAGRNVDIISSTYRASASSPRVSNLGDCNSAELLDDFREALGAAAGISPALQPRPRHELVEVEEATAGRYDVSGVWPVEQPGQRQRHDKFGLYVENLADGYWYSPDTAGHASSVIKRFRRIGRQLEHDADIAQDGKRIPKHKGSVGSVVSLDEMHGV